MIVDLSLAQIKAVLYIMGNSMDDSETVAAIFPDNRNRAAATNAYAKLNNAYIKLMNSDRKDRGIR